MARTGYLHLALGIELAGVGGYMEMNSIDIQFPGLNFFGSGIATVSDLSYL